MLSANSNPDEKLKAKVRDANNNALVLLQDLNSDINFLKKVFPTADFFPAEQIISDVEVEIQSNNAIVATSSIKQLETIEKDTSRIYENILQKHRQLYLLLLDHLRNLDVKSSSFLSSMRSEEKRRFMKMIDDAKITFYRDILSRSIFCGQKLGSEKRAFDNVVSGFLSKFEMIERDIERETNTAQAAYKAQQEVIEEHINKIALGLLQFHALPKNDVLLSFIKETNKDLMFCFLNAIRLQIIKNDESIKKSGVLKLFCSEFKINQNDLLNERGEFLMLSALETFINKLDMDEYSPKEMINKLNTILKKVAENISPGFIQELDFLLKVKFNGKFKDQVPLKNTLIEKRTLFSDKYCKLINISDEDKRLEIKPRDVKKEMEDAELKRLSQEDESTIIKNIIDFNLEKEKMLVQFETVEKLTEAASKSLQQHKNNIADIFADKFKEQMVNLLYFIIDKPWDCKDQIILLLDIIKNNTRVIAEEQTDRVIENFDAGIAGHLDSLQTNAYKAALKLVTKRLCDQYSQEIYNSSVNSDMQALQKIAKGLASGLEIQDLPIDADSLILLNNEIKKIKKDAFKAALTNVNSEFFKKEDKDSLVSVFKAKITLYLESGQKEVKQCVSALLPNDEIDELDNQNLSSGFSDFYSKFKGFREDALKDAIAFYKANLEASFISALGQLTDSKHDEFWNKQRTVTHLIGGNTLSSPLWIADLKKLLKEPMVDINKVHQRVMEVVTKERMNTKISQDALGDLIILLSTYQQKKSPGKIFSYEDELDVLLHLKKMVDEVKKMEEKILLDPSYPAPSSSANKQVNF